MTRASGGSGRQPNRPYKEDGSQPDPLAADFDLEDEANGNSAGTGRSRPARRNPAADTAAVEPNPIDPKKRGIALMGDVILSFALSFVILPLLLVLNFIVPFIAKIITQQMIMIAIILVRDYFYQGHGFGKNLMGMQVVDATTGQPPTLLQSFKRNILFVLPLLVMGVLTNIKFLPFNGGINSVVLQTVYWFCTAYVIILIPAECWYAYSKQDGRRIGDRFANTVVIESPMDFSKPM
jgi:uncharacterized RDD family membrane protein YckC